MYVKTQFEIQFVQLTPVFSPLVIHRALSWKHNEKTQAIGTGNNKFQFIKNHVY